MNQHEGEDPNINHSLTTDNLSTILTN